jgi:hypothetical protein
MTAKTQFHSDFDFTATLMRVVALHRARRSAQPGTITRHGGFHRGNG